MLLMKPKLMYHQVFGLSTDLGLKPGSTQYNTALTIFFVPYIVGGLSRP